MLASTVIVNMFGSHLMQSGPSLAFWSVASMAASLGRARAVAGAAQGTGEPAHGARLSWQR